MLDKPSLLDIVSETKRKSANARVLSRAHWTLKNPVRRSLSVPRCQQSSHDPFEEIHVVLSEGESRRRGLTVPASAKMLNSPLLLFSYILSAVRPLIGCAN